MALRISQEKRLLPWKLNAEARTLLQSQRECRILHVVISRINPMLCLRTNSQRQARPSSYIRLILSKEEGELRAVKSDRALCADDVIQLIPRIILSEEPRRDLNTHDRSTGFVEEFHQPYIASRERCLQICTEEPINDQVSTGDLRRCEVRKYLFQAEGILWEALTNSFTFGRELPSTIEEVGKDRMPST